MRRFHCDSWIDADWGNIQFSLPCVELQFQRCLADRESLRGYAPDDPYVRPRAGSSPVFHVSFGIDVYVLRPIITKAFQSCRE